MPEPQNFKNHARFDPPFHYFVLIVLILNFGFSIYATIHHWPNHADLFLWWIVMSLAFFVGFGKARAYALKAQDRIIRLEETLRMKALLSPSDCGLIGQLAPGQFIALRFASDAELPALTKRAVAEKLTPKQIKEAIVTWRPDYLRV